MRISLLILALLLILPAFANGQAPVGAQPKVLIALVNNTPHPISFQVTGPTEYNGHIAAGARVEYKATPGFSGDVSGGGGKYTVHLAYAYERGATYECEYIYYLTMDGTQTEPRRVVELEQKISFWSIHATMLRTADLDQAGFQIEVNNR